MKIISLSIDVTKIDKNVLIKGKKGTYLPLTIWVNDDKDKYGTDVSCSMAQTKDQRENKEKPVYIGNGKVVFTGESKKEEKPEDDLPW